MFQKYNVIVVGAGHAGCEAAHAAAQMGSKVLLITMNMQTIAQMSCNPAMGGVAKGQIVREIDALGGMSGIISDKSMIQFRMLNRSKGPAMWSPRCQSDRMVFAEKWRTALEQNINLDIWQDSVIGLIIKNNKVIGVTTQLGIEIMCDSVVLTNGTFLNGIIHIGEKQFGGGRTAEKAATGITEQLITLGFEAGRMKTGTPPRVDGRSLNYGLMEEQAGDDSPSKFSFSDETAPLQQQRSCWITYTNEDVHAILREGFDRSPMFTGRIKGLGPRYCPSVEDKINRFADKDRHQIFVEPEGWTTVEVYVNGFSTSLPEDIQMRAIRKITGFENAKLYRPGYAIEYDFFPPTQLTHTLETQKIDSLFFAGQINGTTGYEEAASQGLIAGMNAHLKSKGEAPFTLSRNEAYIGVLIDDLITKGTDEPYRMFTSRAEFRTLLRQDNADIRLTEKSNQIGLASDERTLKVKEKISAVTQLEDFFKQTKVVPQIANELLRKIGNTEVKEKVSLYQLLKRPDINIHQLMSLEESLLNKNKTIHPDVLEQVEINIKYEHYFEKERLMVEKQQKFDTLEIPDNFNYDNISALSFEGRDKMKRVRPQTLGQASRISGVSPADISILLVYLGR
jgi:tRNA uridine 5-carboxymethylaminomethyl modification enzyme